jgi:hypothetical protein
MAEDILYSVNDLLKMNFFVPKYQRGYRWKKEQVVELLEDINKFTPSNDEGKNSWYCLQPLVIKVKDNKYHLIDGQQRLTTIYLILYELNNHLPEKDRKDIFSINYETREKYGDWLEILENKSEAEKNIDFFHIYKSYQRIKKWREETENFRIPNFIDKLLYDCKFIWYDIDQNGQSKDTGESVFIRLNDGKIQLTNSELIKALFLNSSNFAKDRNEEEIRLRQFEISTQWDIIEQELSDDEFWYFINGKENTVTPRIEYLFDIIAQKPREVNDQHFTFRYFQSKFDENEQKKGDVIKFVDDEWKNILNKYLILKEWYKDKERRYYHPIGYLLCSNVCNIGDLLEDYKNYDKDTFMLKLCERMNLGWDGDEEKAQYKQNDELVKKILLLHNVMTMQKQEDELSRFSFCHFIELKKKGWDIEHIHAFAEPPPKDEEHRKDWWNETKDTIKDTDLEKKYRDFSDWANDEAFSSFFEEVSQYFEDNSGLNEKNAHCLSNLALLDASTNRGYKNAFFPVKRKTILKKDKAGEFIPVCTKKVFLKYYTQTPNMTFWKKEDRKEYLDDIIEKLSVYLKRGK